MRIPFIGSAYELNSVNSAIQRCVNLFPEMYEEQEGKPAEVAMLINTPGLSLRPFITSDGAGQIRGMHATFLKRFGFTVSGSKVFYYNETTGISAVAGTLAGALLTSTGTVSMADNGQTMVIVDGDNGYMVDVSTDTPGPLEQITDPDFLGADRVFFIDGYFVFNKPGTQQYYITGLYNADVNALDFSSAEGAPDRLVSILAAQKELWLLGEVSCEVHYNAGDPDFPFQPIQGAFIDYGCAAAHSAVRAANTKMWLSRDEDGHGIVVQASGFKAERVSTHAIEQIIQAAGSIEDAVAYTYQKDGHTFYVLNFTAADTTVVYDLTSKKWHERSYLNTTTGELERHRAQHHMFFGGHNLIGDYATGAVYSFESNVYSDAGNPLVRVRSCAHISDDMHEIFYDAFQLDLETGVGLDGAPAAGVDPQAMLRWSDDSGHTWSEEYWVSIGKIGQFKARALWRRLGRSRDRVFEVRISDPVKVIMTGAKIDATKGRS